MSMLDVIRYPSLNEVEQLLQRPAQNYEQLYPTTKIVVDEVAQYGDEAVLRYTLQFDQVPLSNMLVSAEEFAAAEAEVPVELKQAIRLSVENIHKFHAPQLQDVQRMEVMPGVQCWRKSVPIERVGLYVPGGSAPLFSTVLMLGVPARIAGCPTVVLCTPPNKQGKVHPAILYAAKQVGITQIYKVGGIQAIAALTFGTATIPKVDKIFGPGNAYVTAAKQLVSNMGVAIDMPAGPSEVMVLADKSCNPAFVAADLLSQAEHGPDSQVVLVVNDELLIPRIEQELEEQLKLLPREETTRKSLRSSKIVLINSDEQMMAIANIYAAEHLIISTQNAGELADKVVNAGSVFLGNYSPESAGDYTSGTNHALPTAGYARSYSGVSVDSFVKKITFQQLTHEGIRNMGKAVITMAKAEGLQAHAHAVELRVEN